MLRQLSQLPTLRVVRLYFDEVHTLPDFSGHPECEVHLSVRYSCELRNLPTETAKHLVSLRCWMRDDVGICFTGWQHCTRLCSIVIALESTLPICMAAKPMVGLDKLPALKQLMVYSIQASVCMPPVCIPSGWKAVMSEFTKPMSCAGLFSFGRNRLLTVTKVG